MMEFLEGTNSVTSNRIFCIKTGNHTQINLLMFLYGHEDRTFETETVLKTSTTYK